MKIIYIDFKNFLCHKDTHLELSPGFNVIIGQNESGKSSIVRGIDLNLNNSIRGSDFITHGETCCDVSLTFDNKVSILRRKTSDFNGYIKTENGVNENFLALGANSLPWYKQKGILNVSVDKDKEINVLITNQEDKSIFSILSGYELAKLFGNFLGLGILDAALQKINSKIRDFQNTKKIHSEELQSIKTRLSASDLDLKKHDLDQIKEINAVIQAESTRLESLECISNKIDTVCGRFTELTNIDKAIKSINLDNLKHNASVYETIGRLKIALSDMKLKLEQFKDVNSKITKLKNEFIEKLNELKKCPICSSEITTASIDKIMKGLSL